MQVLAPAIGVALVPKCPLCLAGYIAVWTGIGISMPIASPLRWCLIWLCVTWLAVSLLKLARRRRRGVH
jgi:hypothetical protein